MSDDALETCCRLLADSQRIIERLRLTDAEREAIKVAADAYDQNDDDLECERIAATLRGLLGRTDTGKK